MIKRVVLIVGMTAALVGGLGSGAAYASTPIPVSGNSLITFTPAGAARFADGNQFLPFTFIEVFTGSVSGTRVGTGTLIVHPDGTLNVFGSGTFTGTIAGSGPGTVVMSAEVSGTFASLTAQVNLTDGAGGLAGIHGHLTDVGAATGPVTGAGTYSGQVVFGA